MPIPFYSQKWDLTQWQSLGFKSFADAEYWEKSSCGILCLKMAIDGFLLAQGKSVSSSIASYIEKGIAVGAYTDATGWSHDGLVRLAREFGFFAVTHRGVTVYKLREALKQNFLPIISIKWAFENNRSLKEKILFWKKSGGHLALVIGYSGEQDELDGLYVHHTSIISDYNWPNKLIPIDKFTQGFTGRCIMIKSN